MMFRFDVEFGELATKNRITRDQLDRFRNCLHKVKVHVWIDLVLWFDHPKSNRKAAIENFENPKCPKCRIGADCESFDFRSIFRSFQQLFVGGWMGAGGGFWC